MWPGAAFSEKCEIEASTERLVEWTDGFMRNRRIMSVDGQDSEPLEVTTELPQGSPISPVLFAIYIADIHGAVEGQMEDCRGISFVDDITWVAKGVDLDDVVRKLEGCAAASLKWATQSSLRHPRPRRSSSPEGGSTDDASG